MRNTNPSVALSLNASFLGFFTHAGFLAGLEERGIRPGKVAGASAGALAGAFYASGFSSDEIHELLMAPDLRKHLIEKRALLRIPGVLLGRRDRGGAMSGNKVARKLRSLLGDRRIEDCTDPELAIAVTNLTRSRSQLVRRGDLVDHTVASLSFPGVFATREIDGEHFWDGGISQPVPFGHWAEDGDVETVLVHMVRSGSDDEAIAKRSLNASLHLAHRAVSRDLFDLRKRELERQGKRVLVMRTDTRKLSLFGATRHREECYAAGLSTARAHSKQLRQLESGV